MNEYELAIILPIFNEAPTIEKTLTSWESVLEGLKINYVIKIFNDGSKDGTQEIIENFAEGKSRVKLFNKNHEGYGKTLLMAYNNTTDAEWIFQADTDDEIEPEQFKYLWEKRFESDFIVGIRKCRNSGIIRNLISHLASFIISLLFGKGVTDTNIPFRLLRQNTFSKLLSKIPSGTLYPNLLISGYVNINKIKFSQIPVEYKKRSTGMSHIYGFKLIKDPIISFVQLILFRYKNGTLS